MFFIILNIFVADLYSGFDPKSSVIKSLGENERQISIKDKTLIGLLKTSNFF